MAVVPEQEEHAFPQRFQRAKMDGGECKLVLVGEFLGGGTPIYVVANSTILRICDGISKNRCLKINNVKMKHVIITRTFLLTTSINVYSLVVSDTNFV
jgi:hypothetical protein